MKKTRKTIQERLVFIVNYIKNFMFIIMESGMNQQIIRQSISILNNIHMFTIYILQHLQAMGVMVVTEEMAVTVVEAVI